MTPTHAIDYSAQPPSAGSAGSQAGDSSTGQAKEYLHHQSPRPADRAALQALCALARLHHIAADPATLAHQLGWPPNHSPSLDDLLLAARHLGLKARRSRTSADRLPLSPLPALAVMRPANHAPGEFETAGDEPHIVLLAQCDGQRVLIQDPSGRLQGGRPVIEPLAVFAAQWTGELILVTSRASLAGELNRFDFSWFIPSLVKYRKLFGEVLLVSLFLQLFALVSPLFFQVVMDKVLVHRGLTTLDVLVTGLVVVVLFESLLTALRTYVFSHTTSRIDVELGARLFRHLLALPLAYFQARRVGDSVARVRELENIRSFLTGNALTLVLDVLFSVVFIGVMFLYSVPLTLIVLASLPLYVGLSLLLMPVLRARLNEKFARGAENQALLVESITGIQTVKASALEPAVARRLDEQLAAYVVGSGDTAVEAAGGGIDTVSSSISWTLGSELENLTLTGTGAINATGNTLANTLIGNSVANRLDGASGADSMTGGAGNDTYIGDSTTDTITELAGAGTDTVQSSVTITTLAANVENLTLTGTAAINGTGNALDNVLTGNSANNTLSGGAGNDTLDGGAGNDTMVGGAGNDVYIVNVATDAVTELANEGTDTVQSAVTWTLGTTTENLTLTGSSVINGTGNALNNVLLGNSANNVLTGNAGNDTLDGAVGADTLVGGTGDDVYQFGRGYGADLVRENDATAGNADQLLFLSGVARDQVWFRRIGNNLEVSVIGGLDAATIENWYLGSQYRIEQFRTASGNALMESQVQNLVNAMAAFSPPAAGQTALPSSYQTALQPILAANWTA